jgi:hypothetical protein
MNVANNSDTKELVKLTYRSELISREKLVLKFLVDVQFGRVYQNHDIVNIKEDNQIVVSEKTWRVWNLFQAKILERFG